MKRARAVLWAALLATPTWPQDVTFRSEVKVVVIDVTVLDRNGKPIENLTRDDFQLIEDGRPQTLQSVEYQQLDAQALPAIDASKVAARSLAPTLTTARSAPVRYKDRRLIVMLFDFSSMQPAEQIRAVEAAKKFVSTQISESDVVSIMTFASQLRTVQDFTADRDLLLATLKGFHIGEGSELAGAETGADPEDQSGLFVADDTEFNIFNTDRKLAALEDAARKLAPYPEKKALVYFSSGVEKTGVDNQSQLKATVNAAVKANVSFFPIDARGLTASAPGGDASQGGAAGSGLFSGRGQRAQRDSFNNQQDTLYSLAADTGGKALLDSNDLTLGIKEAQANVNSYYILSYVSTNSNEDGRFRKVQVKLSPKFAAMKAKLDYRPGYFAASTFKQMSSADKESQLQKALSSENPVTELPLALEVDYFRVGKGKYFAPVSVKIPGSALAFKNKGSKAATELDFIAEMKDSRGMVASVVRDTIPLKLDQTTADQVARKQIQYDTGFTLTPGKYAVRLVARENGEGKVGTFEAAITVPDLSSGSGLRHSSVILSNQREPISAQLAAAQKDKRLAALNPLIDGGKEKIVPNVTRVFRPGQNLSAYLEVYDAALLENAPANAKITSVAATMALYQGTKKIAESAAVRVNRMSTRGEGIVPLKLQLALRDIKPGTYICQVSVIDELGRKFAFPRSAIEVFPQLPAEAKN